jgi:hypothetical protein
MRISRIFADADGGSHFADGAPPVADLRLFPQMPLFQVTRLVGANPAKLFSVPADVSAAQLHTAPERQLAVSLNGWVEYETTDGEARRLKPGELMLVEDTWGSGHITRFDDGEQWFLHIPVPDDWHLI